MKLGLTLSHKAIMLVLVPLVFEIGFVVLLVIMLHQTQQQVRKDQEFLLNLNTVLGKSVKMARIIGDYGATRKLELVDQWQSDLKEIHLALDRLRQSLPGKESARTGDQNDALLTINGLESCLEQTDKIIGEDAKNTRDHSAFVMLSRLRETRDILRKLAPAAEKFGEGLTANTSIARQEQNNRKILEYLLAGIVGNILLALSLALYFSRSTVNRLDVLMDNTKRLSAGKALNPPVRGSDEIAHLDRVFNDMADALVAAARKERAIIENAADVICSVDKEGKLSAISPACREVWGFEPEELIDKPLSDLLVPEDRAATIQAFEKVAESKGRTSWESRSRHKDRSIVYILWSVQWSETESALFLVAHDISARKEVDRIKQEFVSMVSHDLRTPLTSVQFFLNMLSDGAYGKLSDNGQKKADLADRNVCRLIKLINDLLDIEKMESGQFQLHLEAVPLSPILERSIDSLNNIAETCKVKIEFTGSSAQVSADPDRLEQVMINLLGNALKFSPPDTKVCVRVEDLNDSVEVQVVDQGRGVPAEMRETIFQRFKQTDASDAIEKKGSGLGLAIAKTIVELHGGQIGVRSENGKGSTFWFTLISRSESTVQVCQA
jgi:PAS domain S-box-containing protein